LQLEYVYRIKLYIFLCNIIIFFGFFPPLQTDDIERPLFSETLVNVSGQSYDLARDSVEESSVQIDGNITSPTSYGIGSNKRIQTDCHVNQGVLSFHFIFPFLVIDTYYDV